MTPEIVPEGILQMQRGEGSCYNDFYQVRQRCVTVFCWNARTADDSIIPSVEKRIEDLVERSVTFLNLKVVEHTNQMVRNERGDE